MIELIGNNHRTVLTTPLTATTKTTRSETKPEETVSTSFVKI
jgi:hypothetical protein